MIVELVINLAIGGGALLQQEGADNMPDDKVA
jgi:hypothetical protein